jgi:hypothetical protein
MSFRNLAVADAGPCARVIEMAAELPSLRSSIGYWRKIADLLSFTNETLGCIA